MNHNVASIKLFLLFLLFFLLLLLIGGGLTVWVDPYFHYHKPIEGLNYNLHDERYQNYGILKSFDYNAIITGTSMTENFKPSELDALFGVKAVKVPFSGGSHLEIHELLDYGYKYNDDIRMVVRSVDLLRAFDTKDHRDYDLATYPTYLYDENPFNDVKYVFNKDIFFQETIGVLRRTRGNSPVTTLDDYANWESYYSFGPASIQEYYSRNKVEPTGNNAILEEEYQTIFENITENVVQVAEEHPETEFYLYIAPYSIYYFDYEDQMGQLDRYMLAERYILSLLVGHPNIHVFDFFGQYDVICDADNYRDPAHHSERVNSMILQWMAEGVGELDTDTYEDFCNEIWEYYHSYDYDSLYEADGYTIK
ncbi:MAG: hypothetical protein K6A92_11040 [Lachnospiraceae bacterium]|nr:hypothetical protein [Lachnospiraceae bacterium]